MHWDVETFLWPGFRLSPVRVSQFNQFQTQFLCYLLGLWLVHHTRSTLPHTAQAGFDFSRVIPTAQGGWQTSIPDAQWNFPSFTLRSVIPHWQPVQRVCFLWPQPSSPWDTETLALTTTHTPRIFKGLFVQLLLTDHCSVMELSVHFRHLATSPFCVPSWHWIFFFSLYISSSISLWLGGVSFDSSSYQINQKVLITHLDISLPLLALGSWRTETSVWFIFQF